MAHKTVIIEGNVADGEYKSDFIPKEYNKGVISITFYSDKTKQTPVRPTVGTVTFTASEDGFNYGDIENPSVDPSNEKYLRPYWQFGAISFVKCALASIAGASYFSARIDVYN